MKSQYYNYEGEGTDCSLNTDFIPYTSDTLVTVKATPEENGVCAVLFYLVNSNENGAPFTVFIYRNSAYLLSLLLSPLIFLIL